MATFGNVWIWIWWIFKWISKIDIHLDIHVYYGYPTLPVYYGYPTWISYLDFHNIHDIQRTELYERVDGDYLSYPEVHHFCAEALS